MKKFNWRLEAEVLRKIFPRFLGEEQRYRDTESLWVELQAAHPPVAQESLISLLGKREGNLSKRRQFIYFKPLPENRSIPIATVEWDFTEEPPRFALRLFLFTEQNHLGFRFESAESEDCAHPFCHCQFIQGWGMRGKPPREEGGPPFWPETYPIFPLPATNGVGLLIGAMVTLYGPRIVFMRFLGRLVRDPKLSKALSGTPWKRYL